MKYVFMAFIFACGFITGSAIQEDKCKAVMHQVPVKLKVGEYNI